MIRELIDMRRYLTPLALAFLLNGCATPPVLKNTATDLKPENAHTLIAKEVLTTMAFGSNWIIKAKIVDATISAPSQETATFSGEPYQSYCVNAYVEDPLFSTRTAVSANVRINAVAGRPMAFASARTYRHCTGSNFEAFPELERLAALRDKQA